MSSSVCSSTSSKEKKKRLEKQSEITSVYVGKESPSANSSTEHWLFSSDIDENFIFCDKCDKWRLLPYHCNVDKLSKKWSGMNSCDISEEETTRAVRALNQVHVLDFQSRRTTLPDHLAECGITSAGILNVVKTHRGMASSVYSSTSRKERKKRLQKESDNIEENWIVCDKCQNWRLLPYDCNVNRLPEKWLCSMSYWLPGRSSCDIGEEETTRAVRALNQVHVLEFQSRLNTLPDQEAASGIAGLLNVDKTHQGRDVRDVIRRKGGKKLKVEEPEYATIHGHTDSTKSTIESSEPSVNSEKPETYMKQAVFRLSLT